MAMTPENKEAARQRMLAMHAKKREQKANQQYEIEKDIPVEGITTIGEPIPLPPTPKPETISTSDDVEELKRQIAEMKDMMWRTMAQQQPQQAQVNAQGLTGTVDRYNMDLTAYTDPGERLKQEPKLQRFAFTMNYETEFKVSETSYTTIDKVRMREPKFTLELIRVMLDEETGEDTGGRYSVARLTLHEDPDTALTIARSMGMDIEGKDEQSFLSEMRYIRMRDWLLDCFYPPKAESKSQRKQMVIAGRLVEYWEKNTDKGTGITKDQWDSAPRIKF